MSSRHLVRRDGELDLAVPVGTTATGFRRCFVVDEETQGAVHTGFAICETRPAMQGLQLARRSNGLHRSSLYPMPNGFA